MTNKPDISPLPTVYKKVLLSERMPPRADENYLTISERGFETARFFNGRRFEIASYEGEIIYWLEEVPDETYRLEAENKALTVDMGLTEIELAHERTLRTACEKALETAHSENKALREQQEWHPIETNTTFPRLDAMCEWYMDGQVTIVARLSEDGDNFWVRNDEDSFSPYDFTYWRYFVPPPPKEQDI